MRKTATGILIGAALAVLLFAAWLLSPWHQPELVDPIASLGLILISLLISIFSFYIAATRSFPRPLRQAWGFIGLANVSGAIAETIWFYFYYILGTDPFPSIADVFYLLTYPLLLVGILSLPYAPLKREQRLVLNLDLSIVVLAFGALLWRLILAHLIGQGSRGLPGLVSLAYPVADLLIVIGLVSLIQQDVQDVGRKVLTFFVCGMAITILADIGFALGETLQTSIASAAVDIPWLVGRWAILAAVIWQAGQTQFEAKPAQNFAPLLRTNLLYAAVLAGTGLAFAESVSLFQSNLRLYGTLLGTLTITALVLLRQYFVLQDNRRLYTEVEHLAVTDALTGLSNRRFFDIVLAQEVVRAQRYHRPLSLLLIDIDRFKEYNDRKGHLQGDMLLRDFARLLRTQLRASDLVARYGGDEFVVILPETDVEMSRAVAGKLRSAVQSALAPGEGISISTGCAALQPEMTAVALLGLADQGMYREKPRRESR